MVVAVSASVAGVVRPGLSSWIWRPRHTLEHVVTFPVRHADLDVTVSASGRVESANRTVIECELEAMEVRVRGQGNGAGGSSTVLSLVPEGTEVKKGDVLCTLDSSEYEELVRQQEMNVERAKADHLQAQLDLDVARMALREFLEGNLAQDLKQMRGQIALSESDLERQKERLTWTRRMRDKGYVPLAQINSEEVLFRRAEVALAQARTGLAVYQKYTVPRITQSLEGTIFAAQANMAYQDARLKRQISRLDRLKLQVDRCTIRAPHDGFVIYANDERHGIYIEEGMYVRQYQRLFYLPDLTKMQVEVMLHESVVRQIHDGMPAQVRVEGLNNRQIEGRVIKVSQLAEPQNRFSEVRYFTGLVQLNMAPKGLLPGMTAEVEIMAGRRPGVLAIPSEALAIEDGREVCYVAHEEGLERREVKVGQSTREFLEVTTGLEAGEQVVLDPDRIDSEALADAVISPAETDESRADETDALPVTQ